jgi:hypothetical protein
MMMFFKRLAIFLLPAAVVFIVISCSIPVDETGRGIEVVKEYDSLSAGSFTLKVSNTQISTAEELSLVLEATADEKWGVVFPEIQDSLDKFRVIDRTMETRRLDTDGNLIYTRTYTLEPFLPGDYIITPFEITFEEEDGFYSFSYVSDEIYVEVSSVLPPLLGEQDIEEIWGPLSLQRRMVLWIVISGISLAAAGTGLVYVARRRSVYRSSSTALNPLEAALNELDILLSKKLIELGRYREFYDSISDLIRRYVESRFNIRAPEQTTEEFLQNVRHSIALSKHTSLLEEFLRGCDLVKFACYEPSFKEVERTVHTCESFLTGTAVKR